MTVQILRGDCRQVLSELADESVHCVVTSPPYFGLRDYGTADWQGGDPDCKHGPRKMVNSNKGHVREVLDGDRAVCYSCGALRIDSQIGLEPTPDAFVAELVTVFRDVRRVLRKDGTVWLNLGDSYANDGKWGGHTGGKHVKALHCSPIGRIKKYTGLKPKDLIGIPWMCAFALRTDGWYLRQDIIWSKPNPMPESVTDRCTKAHEYLFLLAKSERYYFDADAIAETVTQSTVDRLSQSNLALQAGSWRVPGKTNGPMKAVGSLHMQQTPRNDGERWRLADGGVAPRGTRNKRSVWEVTTQPFAQAHFATFPPALIEPCVLAGCPKGGTVLDPFGGAGTTGLVADRLGRNAILIELNPAYAAMAEQRIKDDAGMFAEVLS